MCTPALHLFSLYKGELTFRQTIWDKNQVLLGTCWGNTRGTWEYDGNKEEKQKKLRPPHTQKEKTGPIMSAC